MTHQTLCVFCLALFLIVVGPLLSVRTANCTVPSPQNPADEAALRTLIERYCASYGSKDTEAFARLWSDQSPDLAQAKARLKEFFSLTNLTLIEKSSPTAKLSWTPLHQLKRNVLYIWQVTAVKDGREITAPSAPDREARFKVLSSERAAALTEASARIAGSHLKLGIVYANSGLLDEAEREFRAAIAANQDAALARKLLQDTRQMRR
jgi:hypothetical protein